MKTAGPIKISYCVIAVLLGFGIGLSVSHFTGDDCPEPAEPPALIPIATAVFDESTITKMLDFGDPASLRFYLAKDGDGLTSLAGPIDEHGRHITDLAGVPRFWMFKGITSGSSDMSELSWDEAQVLVSDASPRWSIDITKDAAVRFFEISKCNGIALIKRNTTEDNWTFDLFPVEITGSSYTVLGTISDARVGSPCPMNCPHGAGAYLHY